METTTTFDLPFGYEDKDGTLHKTVVMRRVRNIDLFKVNSDPRVRRVALDGAKMSLGGIVEGSDGKPEIKRGDVNPVAEEVVNINVAEFYCVLLPHVVLSVGSIPEPKYNIFAGMYRADLESLIHKYEGFNKPPEISAAKEGGDAESSIPL